MEYLRWVLLAAGIIFVVVVYLLSRQRNNENNNLDYSPDENDLDDAAEFGSQDWDDFDEAVSDVRVVAKDREPEYEAESWADDDGSVEEYGSGTGDDALDDAPETEEFQEHTTQYAEDDSEAKNDIIVLHILANADQILHGDHVNSAARSNGLVFGDMNIFQRLDENDQPVYSLANMLEPGSFDPENIHTMTTPGITFFMQPAEIEQPDEAFDDMLQCAYQISEILGAQLCNQHRKPLTEKDAEHYREIVACYHGE